MSNSWCASCNGSIYGFCLYNTITNESSSVKVIKTSISFSKENGGFKSSAINLKLRFIAHKNIVIHACKAVVSTDSYIQHCYILLGNLNEQSDLHLCVVGDGDIFVIGKIKLNESVQKPAEQTGPAAAADCRTCAIEQLSCCLVNGPHVVMVINKMLFYTCQRHQLHHIDALPSVENPSTLSLLLCERVGEYIFVLGLHTEIKVKEDTMTAVLKTGEHTANNEEISTRLFSLLVMRDAPNLCTVLDSTDFIPTAYATIALCCTIERCADVDDQNEAVVLQRLISSNVFLCTSYSQLLVFSKGHLLRCVTLPFEDSTEIFTFKNGAGTEYVVVRSLHNVICVAEMPSLQVVANYASVSRVYIDDFLCCGADQLLLVAADCESLDRGELTRFCLTDFHTCHEDRLKQVNTPALSSECGENLQSAIGALHTRLHVGAASLDSAQRSGKRKVALIAQSCRSMQGVALHNDPVASKPKPVLQSLFPHSVMKLHQDDTATPPSGLEHTLRVDLVWKRFIYDCVVLGIHLTNLSKRGFVSPRLSVVSSGSQGAGVTQTTWNQRCWAGWATGVTGGVTGSMTHDSTVCLSACIAVPQFGRASECRFALLVTWRESSDDVERTVCCGYVTLSVDQLLKGLHAVHSPQLQGDDVTALDTAQDRHRLMLRTTVSDASCLATTLRTRLGFEAVVTDRRAGGDGRHVTAVTDRHDGCDSCHVCRVTGPLDTCRVCLHAPMTDRRLEFVVHVRNDSQLFLLLHALYRLLPDDVVILPANQKGRNTLLRTTEVLNSLRTEITFAARAARDLLRGSKKEQPAGKIEDVQQELKRLKEQLLAVDGHVCEGENFAQFKVKLEKLQSLTDGAVINLCEAATQIS